MFGGLVMWSDNETTIDLIGFKVHSDLILDVVTDPELLPVVLGVFGDWGGGKSSIMRMLEQSLETDKYKDVVCLYFNGWTFEGYEDAKTALISSILVRLGEHKDFGEKAKVDPTGVGFAVWQAGGESAELLLEAQLNIEERIGTVAVHEAEHVNNPQAQKRNNDNKYGPGGRETLCKEKETQAIRETVINRPLQKIESLSIESVLRRPN